MKTLLRIDASIRLTGSITRSLPASIDTARIRRNPDGTAISHRLVSFTATHLTQTAFESFKDSGEPDEAVLSARLVDELRQADHLLIGSPLYNLGLPSSIKAYFDHVVRSGVTFVEEGDCYKGLLKGKAATLITARAGYSSADYADDFQTDYLKQILAFIGISAVETVALEGVAEEPAARDKAVLEAKREIDSLCGADESPDWLGGFSQGDKQAISRLRRQQAEAIIDGDAMAYAELCTDDIQLLIPERDLIAGKQAFIEAERALFSSASFVSFRKHPLRVERSGALAIEVGYQEVQMQSEGHSGGVFSARQKYTHVFRRTDQGWRFSLLMSNPCE